MIFAFECRRQAAVEEGIRQRTATDPDGPRLARHRQRKPLLLSGNGRIGCYEPKRPRRNGPARPRSSADGPGGWGYAESVLIYKNMAIFKPGGKNCIVALDKTSGQTDLEEQRLRRRAGVWLLPSRHVQGQPMIVTGTNRGMFAVDAANGKLLWSNDWSAGNMANCPTPAYEDGYVFWANGYGKGGICLKLKMDGGKVGADVAWKTKRHGLPARRLRYRQGLHLRQTRNGSWRAST